MSLADLRHSLACLASPFLPPRPGLTCPTPLTQAIIARSAARVAKAKTAPPFVRARSDVADRPSSLQPSH